MRETIMVSMPAHMILNQRRLHLFSNSSSSKDNLAILDKDKSCTWLFQHRMDVDKFFNPFRWYNFLVNHSTKLFQDKEVCLLSKAE